VDGEEAAPRISVLLQTFVLIFDLGPVGTMLAQRALQGLETLQRVRANPFVHETMPSPPALTASTVRHRAGGAYYVRLATIPFVRVPKITTTIGAGYAS